MNLIYFKSDIGNFGDDLNPWLWPQLLGDYDDYPEDIDFVGIGSILDDRIFKDNPDNKKVIFGSGVRDFNFSLSALNNVEVSFVRGPISSRLTNGARYITDAAYALRLLPNIPETKKYRLSYIPYFRNYHFFDWKFFEKVLGIHVINPCASVEHVIREIKSSENVLTSAMHGAILADIYRVPWMRVRFTKSGREPNLTSELKWQDWLRSIDLTDVPIHDFDYHLNSNSTRYQTARRLFRFYRKFKHNSFSLSSEETINKIDREMLESVQDFIEKYKT